MQQRQRADLRCAGSFDVDGNQKIFLLHQLGFTHIQGITESRPAAFAQQSSFHRRDFPYALSQPLGNRRFVVIHHFGKFIVVQPAADKGMAAHHNQNRV